ncbi:MAG: phosphatase PAP2 family protein [FCB group bacterium]|nr:phosphatase PAP2 family protein [FCB group bacterium]
MIDRTAWRKYATIAVLFVLAGQIRAGLSGPDGSIRSAVFTRSTGESAFWRPAFDARYSDGTPDPGIDASTVGWRFKRRYFRDLATAASAIVSDLGFVYSSPPRLNRRNALWLGGFIGIGAVIYIHDQDIRDAVVRSKDATLYKPIRKLGDEFEPVGHMGNTNRYYLAAILAGYAVGYKPLVMIPAEILEAQLIAGVLKDAGNIAVGRSRPFEGLGPRHFDYNQGTSFPSGHAKNIIIAARVVSRRTNYLPVTLAAYGIAGAVSLQRISSDSHWPSDVYFSAVYGWISANELLIRHDGGRELTLAPSPPGPSNTLGLRLAYKF